MQYTFYYVSIFVMLLTLLIHIQLIAAPMIFVPIGFLTQYRYPTHRSVTDQQKAKSKNRRGATDTVEAIQQTAVARQQRPGVFQAHFPFK